ncbi:unnamed protein product [Cylicocyclus nassatus]|uniref:Spermine synthase n=1 Tax=Cylicocyclus nassatus TaxID=53992 RepID=A0AA36GMQ8_CYLNA|nr:unnamed protein product [Cylicocyclus nassatus]
MTVEYNKSHSVLSTKEIVETFAKMYKDGRLLDVIVIEDGSHIRIIDKIISPPSLSERLRAVRFAVVKDGYHSYAVLSLPKQLTKEAIDTSQWRVDRTVLDQNLYYSMMIEALSLSDLVTFTHDCNARILSVGLGGGTINGFLHQGFPKINITVVEISRQMVNMARKWFGFVEDDYHRVVVSDGVKFIAEAVKKGNVFDAILLDACTSDPVEAIICPYEAFLNEDVLKSISYMLPKQGIFVVNALSKDMEVDDVYQILTIKFKAFFAYCNRLQSPFTFNQVIYCSHQPRAREPPVNLQQLLNKTLTQFNTVTIRY